MEFPKIFKAARRVVFIASLAACVVILALAPAGAQEPASTLTVLHTFTGTPDGSLPQGSDPVDVNGTLYGVTAGGGTGGFGTIYKLSPAGAEKILYNFTGGADGANPTSTLIQDTAGNFYGTTQNGGDLSCVFSNTPGCGVVYELTKGGKLVVLYTFLGGTDGALPQGLAMDTAGNLYGPTFYGGDVSCFAPIGCGVIYKVNIASKKQTTIHTFEFDANGATPQGFLTVDSQNNLYGAMINGGNLADCGGAGCGLIFKMNTKGTEKVLYTFTGGTDGAGPTSGLVLDSAGNVYGNTFEGGDQSCVIGSLPGCGVIFEISQTTGKEKVLHMFAGTPDGAGPTLGVTRDASGNLFTTTAYGGADNFGTLFEVSAAGKTKVLYSFTGGTDGGNPFSGVTLDSSGTLFGNTVFGGDLSCNSPNGCGTAFEFKP